MNKMRFTEEPNKSYTEIFELEHLLQANNIPYKTERLWDGWVVKCGTTDAIEHCGSYGSEQNLLETWDDEDVIGHLTAQQVFELWQEQGQF